MNSEKNRGWLLLGAAIIGTLAASFTGCSTKGPGGVDREIILAAESDAVAVLVMSSAVVGQERKPDDGGDDDRQKPGDTCRQCNGSGKSGDGQGDCPYCEGGTIREVPAIFTTSELGDAISAYLQQREPEEPVQSEPAAAAEPVESGDPHDQEECCDKADVAEAESPLTVTLYVHRPERLGWPKQWWIKEQPKLIDAGATVPPVVEIESGPSRLEAVRGETKREWNEYTPHDEILALE